MMITKYVKIYVGYCDGKICIILAIKSGYSLATQCHDLGNFALRAGKTFPKNRIIKQNSSFVESLQHLKYFINPA